MVIVVSSKKKKRTNHLPLPKEVSNSGSNLKKISCSSYKREMGIASKLWSGDEDDDKDEQQQFVVGKCDGVCLCDSVWM